MNTSQMKRSKSMETFMVLYEDASSIGILPEEILTSIYGYFSLEMLLVSECVNSQWQRQLISNESIWLDTLLRVWASLTTNNKEMILSAAPTTEEKNYVLWKKCLQQLPKNKISKNLVFGVNNPSTLRIPSELNLIGLEAQWLGNLGSNRSVLGNNPFPSHEELSKGVCAPSFFERGNIKFGITNIGYFEVSISPEHDSFPAQNDVEPVIAIGIGTRRFRVDHKLPGWCFDSIGLHGDDGCIYHDSKPSNSRLCQPLHSNKKHIVGCGIIPLETKKFGIFFTHNQKLLFGTSDSSPILKMFNANADLFPAVGLDSTAPISVNFGQSHFINLDPTHLPSALTDHIHIINKALRAASSSSTPIQVNESFSSIFLPKNAMTDDSSNQIHDEFFRMRHTRMLRDYNHFSQNNIVSRFSHGQNTLARHFFQFAANLRHFPVGVPHNLQDEDDATEYHLSDGF